MFIIQNVLALIEIIVEMSSMCEHYNCIHNILSTKVVTISVLDAFEARETKKKKSTLHFFSFSIQCVDINESQWRDNHKKLYVFSLYLQENVCTNDYTRQKKKYSHVNISVHLSWMQYQFTSIYAKRKKKNG